VDVDDKVGYQLDRKVASEKFTLLLACAMHMTNARAKVKATRPVILESCRCDDYDYVRGISLRKSAAFHERKETATGRNRDKQREREREREREKFTLNR